MTKSREHHIAECLAKSDDVAVGLLAQGYLQMAELAQSLEADARRYRFIRSYLVRAGSLHMDGTAEFRMAGGWPMKHAKSFDEAIDDAIDRVEAERSRTT